jgi:hypothetical protein
MRKFLLIPAAFLSFIAVPALAGVGENQLSSMGFDQAEVGSLPTELLIIGGSFSVVPHGSGKALELPGAPLDTYGLLFGPPVKDGLIATARIHGTKDGRKYPAFAISLNGVGGYRLQVSPAKNSVELIRADRALKSAPFAWISGEWTSLKLQLTKAAEGKWLLQGKVWPAAAAEPEQWSIVHEVLESPGSGKAGVWGIPYAGTPILFDELRVEVVP